MADSSAPAPAEPTSEAPTSDAASEGSTSATPARRWRLAGFVAGSLAVSAALHLALVGTVLVLGSWGRPPAPVKAVPVDVVTEDQLAEMEKQPDPKPEQPPAQPQIPDISSQPQQQAQPPQAPSPQTQSGAASEPAAPPPPPPPSSQPQAPPSVDAFAPPVAPSEAPATSAPPPPPPAPTTGQAAQLAEMLGLPKPAAVSGGPPSDYKANLTADEVAGFASHVQSCWTAPPASLNAANLTVFIRVRLKRDGSLAGPPEPLGGSASMQALTLLQSSLNALKQCPAYTALPADKYNEWRVLDLRFTPNGISVAPARGAARPG